MGCEGYDFPEDPFILKGSCQLVYSLRAPRRGGGGRSGDSGFAGSYREWENGNNPTWDGRPAGRKQSWDGGGGGTERDFGSRLVTWAVLGVVGYVLYNMFNRAAEAPAGGESNTLLGGAVCDLLGEGGGACLLVCF